MRSEALPRSRAWDQLDWAICIVMGTLALLLFSIGCNAEFQGDDDYLYAANCSTIANAILGIDMSGLKSFGSSLVELMARTLVVPRHAPLPSFISATFYAVCYVAHIPFSLGMLHVPLAAVSAASPLLLYGLLRRNPRLNRWLCLAGLSLLLISPLYVNISRGLASYFMAFTPFTTLVGLWGLDTLQRNAVKRWWIGLALAQIVLSDLLWFVILPVLIASYITAASDRRKAVSMLFSVKVLGPLAMTVFLFLLGTWRAHQKGLSTPLLNTLMDHGNKMNQGSPVIMSPLYVAECLSVLMGIALPILLPIGAILWWIDGRPRVPGMLTVFALIGVLVFGTIFYGLTPERVYVKLGYQIYLLLPLVVIVVVLLSVLQNRQFLGFTWLAVTVSVLLFFEGLACINYSWGLPLSPFSRIFQGWPYGSVVPKNGTKAAGYVVRKWIEKTWRIDPQRQISVYVSHITTSFAVFSGVFTNVGESGGAFIREFGSNRPVTIISAQDLMPNLQYSVEEVLSMVYLLDLTGTIPPDAVARELLLHPSWFFRYRIKSLSGRSGTAVVYVRAPDGIAAIPIPPGDVDMDKLEAGFDREYRDYSDFFSYIRISPRRKCVVIADS